LTLRLRRPCGARMAISTTVAASTTAFAIHGFMRNRPFSFTLPAAPSSSPFCPANGRDQRGRPEILVIVEALVGRPPLHQMFGGLQTLQVIFRYINVEVAVDLECFDLFGKYKSLPCLVRRNCDFLAIYCNANRHRETLDDLLIVERKRLPVHFVFKQRDLCRSQVLVKYFSQINASLAGNV